MKTLASLAVKALAIVGAFQVYKEFTAPETSDRTVRTSLDDVKTTVHNFAADLSQQN